MVSLPDPVLVSAFARLTTAIGVLTVLLATLSSALVLFSSGRTSREYRYCLMAIVVRAEVIYPFYLIKTTTRKHVIVTDLGSNFRPKSALLFHSGLFAAPDLSLHEWTSSHGRHLVRKRFCTDLVTPISLNSDVIWSPKTFQVSWMVTVAGNAPMYFSCFLYRHQVKWIFDIKVCERIRC